MREPNPIREIVDEGPVASPETCKPILGGAAILRTIIADLQTQERTTCPNDDYDVSHYEVTS